MSIGEGRNLKAGSPPNRNKKIFLLHLKCRAPLLLGPREAAVYYSIWHSGSYHGLLSEGSVVKI